MTAPRPDFNEYPNWCANNNDRGGTPVSLFIIHTEEGGSVKDGAQNLSDFLISTTGGPNPVSSHYTISQDPDDHGVTVVDCVGTNLSSWSVGAANDGSINLCFAGSTVNWSTDEWMQQSGAIDVAAYIAVRDCVKYGIPLRTMPPPYNGFGPGSWGITDHQFVTDVIGWGTHVDCGPNFPWNYFTGRIDYWASQLVPPPSNPATYRIVHGDTLKRIAARFGVSLADLLAANPAITNPDVIKVGQVVNIPPRKPAAALLPQGPLEKLLAAIQAIKADLDAIRTKLGA